MLQRCSGCENLAATPIATGRSRKEEHCFRLGGWRYCFEWIQARSSFLPVALQFPVNREFHEFGASRLPIELRDPMRGMGIPTADVDARRAIRAECPTTPGVYGWISSEGHLIYIGKSKSLRHRLLSYFAKCPSDPKMGRIRRQAVRIVWEPVRDELLALLREQELICRFRPEFNTLGQPHRRLPGFVAISRSLAPHAMAVKKLDADCQIVFGPIAGMNDLRQAVTVLNHWFRLRDCADRTRFDYGDQKRLFADDRRALCLRHELGSCPGPCAALCGKSDYLAGLLRAIAFLHGRDRSCLAELERRMKAASNQCQFERAGLLRDRWQALVRLDRQLTRLRKSEASIHGILPIPTATGRSFWLILNRGQWVDQITEPRTVAQKAAARDRLMSHLQRTAPKPKSVFEIQAQLIIAAWFRKNSGDLNRILAFESLLESPLRPAI